MTDQHVTPQLVLAIAHARLTGDEHAEQFLTADLTTSQAATAGAGAAAAIAVMRAAGWQPQRAAHHVRAVLRHVAHGGRPGTRPCEHDKETTP